MASPILTPGNNAEWVGSRKIVGRDENGNYRVIAINANGEIIGISNLYGVDESGDPAQPVIVDDRLLTSSGIDADGDPAQPLLVNDGNQVTITRPHWEVHHGEMFTAAKRLAGVDNGNSVDFLVVTGASLVPHAVVTIGVSAMCWADIYPLPTVTDDGTEITAFNNNGASSESSTTKVYHTPSLSDTGDVALEIIVPGGTKSNAVGSIARPTSEFILPASSKWLFRATSKAGVGASADIGFFMEFYEEPPGVS